MALITWKGEDGWARVVKGRPVLTAKALRALGHPVPKNIGDHEVIELREVR